MQTKLLTQFNSENPDIILELSDTVVQIELNNLIENKNDYLFSLYALERLPQKFNYEQAVISQLRPSPKYSIYNLRILRLLKDDIRYTKFLLNILKIVKAENKDSCNVDMNRLKVGTDTAKTYKFVQFVKNKSLKLLIKYLKSVSNSVGFPEIAFWIIKELKEIGGCEECIALLERQKNYVEGMRKDIKIYDKQALEKLENEIKKIDHQLKY